MAREELKWQNIDADDLPADVKKSFDAMVEAEATFKAHLEKLLKNEGHMPEDKFLVMRRRGKRIGVAFASSEYLSGVVVSYLNARFDCFRAPGVSSGSHPQEL